MDRLLHILILIACLVFVPGVSADTLRVCQNGCVYSTVQTAVDAAVDGDVISIAPGLYVESVQLPDNLSLTFAVNPCQATGLP